MKPWQVLFKQAPRSDRDTQGASTGDDDFLDEAADDALAEEGDEEIEEDGDGEDEDPESEDPDEEQSDEDEDPEEDEEEAEEEDEEQEEEAPAEDRFKDPKTGDFDFKRINKVVGGNFLEKAFREQNATITRNFQELKSYKEFGTPEKVTEFSRKSSFLDDLIDNNPVVQAEVFRVLGVAPPGGARAGNPRGAGALTIPGADPGDPILPVLTELHSGFQAINNRLLMEDRKAQQREHEQKFSTALEGAKARFKELSGKNMTDDQAAVVSQEMKTSGYLNGANLVPSLFWKEIQDAAQKKIVAKRVAKKNLPKNAASRRPPPAKKGKRYREDDRDDLWNKHMADGAED